jgi:hypothetical protein
MLPVYNPKIEIAPIYAACLSKRVLRYNHDVDVVKFKGRYYAAWNANAAQGEDLPGQYNYLSVSDDYVHWSEPYPFLADHHCLNPVSSDNQWQPVFVNCRDEKLFCVWCDFWARKTFVAVTADGESWRNFEVENAPASLKGKVIGFPTNHGFVSSTGRLVVPCSLPPYFDDGKRFYKIDGLDYELGAAQYGVGISKYCGNLLSDDDGESWYWSEPVAGAKWSEIGEEPAKHGGEDIILWEPSVFETQDGRMGLLVRNSTSQNYPARKDDPHHMLLAAWSEDGGKSWSKAKPVELDTTYSRNLTLCGTPANPEALLMVHNDHPVNLPSRIPMDRYSLSLFLAPVPDPDLMLPGPLVQPESGRAFYPNGFIDGDTLKVGYTTGNNSMYSGILPQLPDFSRPFLLPRAGRPGLKIENGKAILTQASSSLGLVLTPELTRKENLSLQFEFKADLLYVHNYWTVLTLGGKTRDGLRLVIQVQESGNAFKMGILDSADAFTELCPFHIGASTPVSVDIGQESVAFESGKYSITVKKHVLRKICFGGLYEPPPNPEKLFTPSHLEIPLSGIHIC